GGPTRSDPRSAGGSKHRSTMTYRHLCGSSHLGIRRDRSLKRSALSCNPIATPVSIRRSECRAASPRTAEALTDSENPRAAFHNVLRLWSGRETCTYSVLSKTTATRGRNSPADVHLLRIP